MKGPGDGWAFPSGSAGDYVALTVKAIEADPGSRRRRDGSVTAKRVRRPD
jgi:hypothetical protein